MAHLYGDKGVHSQSVPTRKALPFQGGCLFTLRLSRCKRTGKALPSPLLAWVCRRGWALRLQFPARGLAFSSRLLTVFKVSKEKHGKDRELERWKMSLGNSTEGEKAEEEVGRGQDRVGERAERVGEGKGESRAADLSGGS